MRSAIKTFTKTLTFIAEGVDDVRQINYQTAGRTAMAAQDAEHPPTAEIRSFAFKNGGTS
jgi:hypothetical protein